jgi:hypothetical protein
MSLTRVFAHSLFGYLSIMKNIVLRRITNSTYAAVFDASRYLTKVIKNPAASGGELNLQ